MNAVSEADQVLLRVGAIFLADVTEFRMVVSHWRFIMPSSADEGDGAEEFELADGAGTGVGDDVGVGALRQGLALVGAVPGEVLVVGGEDHVAATVEDGDVELVHIAGTDDVEGVVVGFVGGEDGGTVEAEGVDGDDEGAIDMAAEGVVALHRDDVGAVGIDVEVVRHRLAGGGGAVAEEPLGVVAAFGLVGEVDDGHFGVDVVGGVFEVDDGEGHLLDEDVDGGDVTAVGGIAGEVVAGVLAWGDGDGGVVSLSGEVGVAGVGFPFIPEGAGAGEGDAVARAVLGAGGIGGDLGGDDGDVDAVPGGASGGGGYLEVVGGVLRGGTGVEDVAAADGAFASLVEVAVPGEGAAGEGRRGFDVGLMTVADDGVGAEGHFGVGEVVDGVVEGVGAAGLGDGDEAEGVGEVGEGAVDGARGVEAAVAAVDGVVFELPDAGDDAFGDVGDIGGLADTEGAFFDVDAALGGLIDEDGEGAGGVAGGPVGIDDGFDGVGAWLGEDVFGYAAFDGVEEGGVVGAALVEVPGGEGVNDVWCVGSLSGDAAEAFEVDGAVALGGDIGVDDGLGVADLAVEGGVEGLVGVHGGGHDASVGLYGYGVVAAAVAVLIDDEVVYVGNEDVGGGSGDEAPADVAHTVLVGDGAVVAVVGDVPGVGEEAFGGAEGVDVGRFTGRASRGGDLHGLAAAGDVGVDGVNVVDAVGGVHLYADGVVDPVEEADGDAGPGLVAVAAGGGGSRGGVAGEASHPGFGQVAGDGRRGDVEPEAVVEGGVLPLAGGGVLADDADEELASLAGRVVVAASHDGVVDEEEGVLRVDLQGVEEGFGAFVVAVAADARLALACGAHIAQTDRGGVSGRDTLHALSGSIDGEEVEAGIGGGVDAEALVVAVEDRAVVGAGAAVGAVA